MQLQMEEICTALVRNKERVFSSFPRAESIPGKCQRELKNNFTFFNSLRLELDAPILLSNFWK